MEAALRDSIEIHSSAITAAVCNTSILTVMTGVDGFQRSNDSNLDIMDRVNSQLFPYGERDTEFLYAKLQYLNPDVTEKRRNKANQTEEDLQNRKINLFMCCSI